MATYQHSIHIHKLCVFERDFKMFSFFFQMEVKMHDCIFPTICEMLSLRNCTMLQMMKKKTSGRCSGTILSLQGKKHFAQNTLQLFENCKCLAVFVKATMSKEETSNILFAFYFLFFNMRNPISGQPILQKGSSGATLETFVKKRMSTTSNLSHGLASPQLFTADAPILLKQLSSMMATDWDN